MTALEQARAADRYAPQSDASATRAELLARAAYRHSCIHEAMEARDDAAAVRHTLEMERLFEMAGRAWQ